MPSDSAHSPFLPGRSQPVIATAVVLSLVAMLAWYVRAGGPGGGLVHHDSPPVANGRFTVNVNVAGAAELSQLPGLGPASAERIVAHRRARGPFTSIDALLDVPGIGPATLEQVRPHLRPIRTREDGP